MRTTSTDGTASTTSRAISTSSGPGVPKLVPLATASVSAAVTAG